MIIKTYKYDYNSYRYLVYEKSKKSKFNYYIDHVFVLTLLPILILKIYL